MVDVVVGRVKKIHVLSRDERRIWLMWLLGE
jgi:hypothetical protein